MRTSSEVPTGNPATGSELDFRNDQIAALMLIGWDDKSVIARLHACDKLLSQTKTVLAGIDRRNPDKSLESIKFLRSQLDLL